MDNILKAIAVSIPFLGAIITTLLVFPDPILIVWASLLGMILSILVYAAVWG